MRYHLEKHILSNTSKYAISYECDHPIYSRCTLYLIGDKGLAVIQQRFDEKTKTSIWTEIDSWLIDRIYVHPSFKSFFDSRSGISENGLYPTVTIRQLMWGIRMKPLKRERWETYFDRPLI